MVRMLDLGPSACAVHPCVLWRVLRPTLLLLLLLGLLIEAHPIEAVQRSPNYIPRALCSPPESARHVKVTHGDFLYLPSVRVTKVS